MNSELSDELLFLAKELDLCKPFQREWNYESKKELVDLFMRNPDWCLERGYPSLEYLVKHFDTDEQRAQGLYVNREVNETLSDQVYVFVNCTGKCVVKFDVKKAIFPMIYVSQGSRMSFIVDGSDTPFQIYDSSEIKVECINNGKSRIWDYRK